MVELRSGTNTQAPRTPAADDIPQEIEIQNVAVQQEPRTPVRTNDQSIQVHIAGSARRFLRSPSVPGDFRPSTFAFAQPLDFQSAREPNQVDEDEIKIQEEQGNTPPTQSANVFRHMMFEAPMRPLDVDRNLHLDYTKAQSIKLYNKGCEKLPGDLFNGKLLLTWLVQVQDKAIRFTWIPILTIKGKLLTQQFTELTMEDVRAHAQEYQDKGKREAQNAEMLITCLKASITREVYNKVYLQNEKYIIYKKSTHQPVEDGVCFLKTIIDNYHSNTRSSTKQIRKKLAQLNLYMRNIAKGDVSKLCEHTRELIYELNAAGETTNDLLSNLIEALKEAPDVNFQRWLANQVDLWSMRKIDWKSDGSDLMEDAEIYYQEAMNTHKWGRRAQKQDVIYAFKAEESDSEKEDEKPKSSSTYEETIKALTAQLKEYTEAYATQFKSSRSNEMDKKYAWKLIPPKDNEPTVKNVLIDGKTKTYYWCPNHNQWTIHQATECRRQPSRLMKKKQKAMKAIKAKKRANFKAKKEAYLQARAAYHACRYNTSDEEEETSNSDNDEDSNKSFSTYSSEGSNLS